MDDRWEPFMTDDSMTYRLNAEHGVEELEITIKQMVQNLTLKIRKFNKVKNLYRYKY